IAAVAHGAAHGPAPPPRLPARRARAYRRAGHPGARRRGVGGLDCRRALPRAVEAGSRRAAVMGGVAVIADRRGQGRGPRSALVALLLVTAACGSEPTPE